MVWARAATSVSTVLVSGASGIVGYGILRSLRAALPDLRLIGTSIYTDTAAEIFSDVFVRAVPTREAGYVDWLLDTLREHKVDMIIPGIEADLHAWAPCLSQIEAAGAVALVNRPALVSLCQDKWAFYEDLRATNTDCAIDSTLTGDYDELRERFGVPFLLKPRRGFGSRGIVRVDSAASFAEHRDALGPILMAQPIVGRDDAEYTVGVFGDGAGGMCAWLSMRRTLSPIGFTQMAEVVDSEPFVPVLQALCRHFRPVGPTNFQFRLCDGRPKLLEINPRISSSTSIRTAFGYNECAMAVEHALNGVLPTMPTTHGGRAVRYIEDWVMSDDGHHQA